MTAYTNLKTNINTKNFNKLRLALLVVAGALLWVQSAQAMPFEAMYCEIGSNATCEYGSFLYTRNPTYCKPVRICNSGPAEFCNNDDRRCLGNMICDCNQCMGCVPELKKCHLDVICQSNSISKMHGGAPHLSAGNEANMAAKLIKTLMKRFERNLDYSSN